MKKLEKYTEQIFFAASVFLILLGILARFYGYLLNRSLWLDEAFLASSVVQQNYIGLLQPLDYNQGAPVGFLWLTKTFVYLLGHSEYVLRLTSFLSGLLSIFLFYYVLSKIFQIRRPYLGTAFYATIPFLIYYTLEFKPYMLDATISLLSIILIYKSFNAQIKNVYLFIYSVLIVWISFPAIFTLAAFYLLWAISSIYKKDLNKLRIACTGGFLTAASFLVYYLLLYDNLESNQSLAYWKLIQFPLIPTKYSDLILINDILNHYTRSYGEYHSQLILLGTPISCVFLYFSKYRKFVILSLTIVILLLTASFLGKYGMLNRILLFIFPFNILLIVLLAYNLWERYKFLYYFYTVYIFYICLQVFPTLKPEGIYRHEYEVKKLIHTIEKDSLYPVYIFRGCVPQFEYYTGYKNNISRIPRTPVIKNNIIFGSNYYKFLFENPYSWEATLDTSKLQEQVDAIKKFDSIYILFGNGPKDKIDALINKLEVEGTFIKLHTNYGSDIFHYKAKQ